MDFLSTLVILCAVVSCWARPNGAPTSACSSLTPSHSGIEPQRSSAPYSVSAVKSGNKVRVTISSPIGEEFEGFVLQARSNSDKSQIVEGTFTSSQPAKTIDCFRGRQNTLTQKSTSTKTEIITEWTPSNGVNEDVIFRATVAKTFALFWTEIDSSPVKIGSGGGNSRQANQGVSNVQSIYNGCSVSKTCFGYPSDCVRRGDCEILLDFVKVSDGIRFNMYGYIDPQTYMAMAFSSDARMGEDAVTECVREGPDLIARDSWNERDKRNTGTRELPRNSYSSSYRDGLSTCSWTAQSLHTSVNGRRYNLANNTHYLLLAKGPTRDGGLGYHNGRLSSAEAINFTAIEGVEGEGITDAVKVHGPNEESTSLEHSTTVLFTDALTEAKSTRYPQISETTEATHDLNDSSRLSFNVFLLLLLGLLFCASRAHFT